MSPHNPLRVILGPCPHPISLSLALTHLEYRPVLTFECFLHLCHGEGEVSLATCPPLPAVLKPVLESEPFKPPHMCR